MPLSNLKSKKSVQDVPVRTIVVFGNIVNVSVPNWRVPRNVRAVNVGIRNQQVRSVVRLRLRQPRQTPKSMSDNMKIENMHTLFIYLLLIKVVGLRYLMKIAPAVDLHRVVKRIGSSTSYATI